MESRIKWEEWWKTNAGPEKADSMHTHSQSLLELLTRYLSSRFLVVLNNNRKIMAQFLFSVISA